jgi:SCY1-like protein 2
LCFHETTHTLGALSYENIKFQAHIYTRTFILQHILQKLWWQHVWPFLQQEMKAAEVLAAVLQPALAIVQEATANEYEEFILPTFR